MGTLSRRRENILRIIVGEYIATATPVASESIARNYRLGVSPATIRHEVARLEEEGYITRPHPSAGSTPSDKGYRYYIECLIEEEELSEEEQRFVRQAFHRAEQELEEWVHLATILLAQMLKSMALATMPRTIECHFRHLDLVAVQEFLTLIILLIQEAKLKRQLLPLDQALSQDELNAMANKLNRAYKGLTRSQIEGKELPLSPREEQVKEVVVQMMHSEDKRQDEEIYLDGMRHLLSQPEFAKGRKMLDMVEVVEGKSVFHNLFSSLKGETGVKVIIGRENKEEALHRCSVVLNSYEIPGGAKGTVGVIGPTRMPYSRVIPTINYLSSLMSELASGVYA